MLRRFYRLYQEAHVPFFAAALAYYALLSLMPLLFLLVGLFGFLLSGNPALRTEVFQALTELTLALFPARPEMAQSLLDFLTRGAFPLTLGSGLLLLWSGSNFFAALSYALGLIFGRPPGVRSRLLALVTPFLLGLGLILLALLGLALAFLVGLLQDLLGFGLLGLHAVGLLLAAYAYYGAARYLDLRSPAGALAAFALAFLGKWFGYFLVAYWLRLDLPALFPWLPLGEGLLSLAFFWPLRPKAREEPKA